MKIKGNSLEMHYETGRRTMLQKLLDAVCEACPENGNGPFSEGQFDACQDVINFISGNSDKLVEALETISALRGYQGEDMGRVAGYRVAADIADAALTQHKAEEGRTAPVDNPVDSLGKGQG